MERIGEVFSELCERFYIEDMARRQKEERLRDFYFYFGTIMGVLYILAGALLIARGDRVPQLASLLPGNGRLFLGVILIAFGAFRIGRLRLRRRDDTIEHNEQILDRDEHP